MPEKCFGTWVNVKNRESPVEPASDSLVDWYLGCRSNPCVGPGVVRGPVVGPVNAPLLSSGAAPVKMGLIGRCHVVASSSKSPWQIGTAGCVHHGYGVRDRHTPAGVALHAHD